MSDLNFLVDYSKRVSKCKKCKQELEKGSVRLGKLLPNAFGDSDTEMKQYYHIDCLFDSFKRARATTKVIESADDIQGFDKINQKDKDLIIEKIDSMEKGKKSATTKTPTKASMKQSDEEVKTDLEESDAESDKKRKLIDKTEIKSKKIKIDINSDDNRFETFQKICNKVAKDSSHLKKSSVIREFFKNGINEDGFTGDMYTFLKLILPSATNRVFNLNSKQLVKLYSKIFDCDFDEMSAHLNQGDVSETCCSFFTKSENIKPEDKSTLTIHQIDTYLDELTKVTKENDQLNLLEKITKKCTKNDLKTFIRLIKKDLRIDAGSKNILDAVSPNAYAAFQVSRDLKDVVERVSDLVQNGKPGLKKDLSIRINLMTPVKPMLAEACKSVESAFVKCKNGILAEIKYDGERLQLHKDGSKFDFFSRNLKAVQPHKVSYLKEYIPKAFPNADKIILDGEVLLYDTKNKKPLPFGTLGAHKKNEFKDATVCFFVFDCFYLNGEDLMSKAMKDRRKMLEEHIKEIPGRVMLSEQTLIKNPDCLRKLIMRTINEGLEGLVLKDSKSIYEPGKRHWLKVKKDYLDEGSMADTADLVVLGAYYGTGNKGGMKSIFLMGCLNEKTQKWHTVTKVANGFDDKTLEKLQKSIQMTKADKKDSPPDWIVVNKSLIPDFYVTDPKKSPIWELTGAEFSKSDVHTADGISIRFPRVTRLRDDKSWKEATSLQRLRKLFDASKQKSDLALEKTLGSVKRSVFGEKEDDRSKKAKKEKKTKKEIKSESDSESDSDMPSLFKDNIFFINSGVDKSTDLKRYIRAYDGKIVDENFLDEATHVIVNRLDEDLPKNTPKNALK
ncbi:DNA ligase 3, partial [Brachionus plicatilis]